MERAYQRLRRCTVVAPRITDAAARVLDAAARSARGTLGFARSQTAVPRRAAKTAATASKAACQLKDGLVEEAMSHGTATRPAPIAAAIRLAPRKRPGDDNPRRIRREAAGFGPIRADGLRSGRTLSPSSG